MNEPKLPGYRPPRVDDFTPTSLSDVYQPKTPEERAGLATAYAMRDLRRGMRRGFGMINRRLDEIERLRRRRRP